MSEQKQPTTLAQQYKQERDEFENEVIRLREDRRRLMQAVQKWANARKGTAVMDLQHAGDALTTLLAKLQDRP